MVEKQVMWVFRYLYQWPLHKLGIIRIVWLIRNDGGMFNRRMCRVPERIRLKALLSINHPLNGVVGWITEHPHDKGAWFLCHMDGTASIRNGGHAHGSASTFLWEDRWWRSK